MARAKAAVSRQGKLMLIGGAEDKFEQKFILRSFFDYCGGRRARLAILPSASESEESGAIYQQIFTDLGAQSVQVLPLFKREDADLPDVARDLARARGIFLTGGDQNKIVSVLHGTASLRAILSAFEKGATVAGTSAGAAAVSNPMIGGGVRGSFPRSGMVKLSTGLGLTRSLLVDQHFHQRNRIGRLITAVMSFPAMLGIGVDEDTAAVVTPDARLKVLGRGTVTVVDSTNMQSANPATTPDGTPLAFTNLTLHMLVHGGQFDLKKRAVISEE